MITYFKNLWKNYRLNHHTCENNAKHIGTYPISMGGNGWSVLTQESIYKCKICGKLIDID